MSALDVAQLIGGLATLLALLGVLRSWWLGTIGRRWDRYRRLKRLGTGAQLDFFIAVLGEPPTIRRAQLLELPRYDGERTWVEDVEFTECFFIEPDHDVQALVDLDQTVVAFSVTARSPWFRPRFQAPRNYSVARRAVGLVRYRVWWRPLIKVRLHRTRFSDAVAMEREQPDHERYTRARAWFGARAFSYSEAHSFGNPGHYQTFVLSASSAADTRRIDTEDLGTIASGSIEGFDDGSRSVSAAGRRFRHRSVVTTWSVLGPDMPLDAYRLTFGPHGDEIRTLL